MNAPIEKSIRLHAIIFAVLFFLGSPIQLLASSPWCEPPRIDPANWAKRSLSEADTIILGRVYSIKEVQQEEPQEEPEAANTDGASSMSELLRLIEADQELAKTRFDHVVSFEVLKAWKEPIHPIVRTKLYLGRMKDAQSFREGDIYLVVGRNLESTLYRIENRCSDAIWEEWAEKYVAALNALPPSN